MDACGTRGVGRRARLYSNVSVFYDEPSPEEHECSSANNNLCGFIAGAMGVWWCLEVLRRKRERTDASKRS
jgi:hypothetical protein